MPAFYEERIVTELEFIGFILGSIVATFVLFGAMLWVMFRFFSYGADIGRPIYGAKYVQDKWVVVEIPPKFTEAFFRGLEHDH